MNQNILNLSYKNCIDFIGPSETIFFDSKDNYKLIYATNCLLKNSNKHDYSVGYFSSSWIKTHAYGLAHFAKNKGKARWILSPFFNDQDELLYAQKILDEKRILETININIENLMEGLQDSKSLINILAWLLENDYLEIKITKGMMKNADIHEKNSIFQCNNEIVVSSSSGNASQTGYENQRNTTDFFYSLNNYHQRKIEAYQEFFEKSWIGVDDGFKNYSLQEAIRNKIISYRSNDHDIANDINLTIKNNPINTEIIDKRSNRELLIPYKLRDYQIKAYEAWKDNNYKGILEMATGTGKTITSLSMAVNLINDISPNIKIINVCPYISLVDQFSDEAEKFGFKTLRIYGTQKNWLKELNNALKFEKKNLFISVTNKSFRSDVFQGIIDKIDNKTLLIFDEVHHAGSDAIIDRLPQKIDYRIGLSATPETEDEVRDSKLFAYFDGILESAVIKLEDAIKGDFLTKYYYYPEFVTMDQDSFKEFSELSEKISKEFAKNKGESTIFLSTLMAQQARIITNLDSKLDWLKKFLDREENLDFSLFYLGESDFFNDSIKIFRESKFNLFNKFTGQESPQRKLEILNDFEEGRTKHLLAIKCLDEGVDVPATRNAIFLSSSSSNRQFVQRRGRVLRKHKHKEFANLYDVFVLPPEYAMYKIDKSVAKILNRELKRFDVFASLAINNLEARKKLQDFVGNKIINHL